MEHGSRQSGTGTVLTRGARRGLRRAPLRAGFTLTELLVVIAITSVLMVILFVPLSRSLDLSKRGSKMIEGQGEVRSALMTVTRDLQDAMAVLEPRKLNIWGPTVSPTGRNRPEVTGAAPQRYVVPNGVIVLREPRRLYYCLRSGAEHYVTPDDLGLAANASDQQYDEIALSSCPRHPGSPVELRPRSPMEPESRLTIYFIGLKDPRVRYPDTVAADAIQPNDPRDPLYRNPLLFKRTGDKSMDVNSLNSYALLRAEFDPRDPNFANWSVVDADGDLNKNFFYDTEPASAPGGNGQPYCVNWKRIVHQVMDVADADVIRWVQSGPRFLPQAMCNFSPGSVENEVLQPNRTMGSFQLTGSQLAGVLPAVEYVADYGSWTGAKVAGTIPWGYLMGNTQEVNFGPRIQVIDESGLVYDSLDPSKRGRLLAYDALTGHIRTAIPRPDTNGYNATISGYYEVRLATDTATDGNGMPASFGAAKNDTRVAMTTMIVPGSDSLRYVENPGVTPMQARPLHRAGWTGLGPGLDRDIAQPELGLEEYKIDYKTGVITLPDRDPGMWSRVSNGVANLRVDYQIQTNRANDVVRVSYTTKELSQINLGIVEYTRSKQEILPFEVAQRVQIRNLHR
jgi:prepilin-type N-terminal cleavage/methylation domain-containing protein